MDPAVAPQSPDRPKPTLYTLVAVVLSAAVAVGLVLLRSRLDLRLHDADSLAEEFGLPVLGVLPQAGHRQGAVRRLRLEESVRLLCTSLTHASGGSLRSIVVTSSRRGEGKSTVAVELASGLAALSHRRDAVLAVDADLRNPDLHRHLRPALGDEVLARPGLADYLRGGCPIDADLAVPTALPGLRLLPPGDLPFHPSALLGFSSSRAALRDLIAHAEIVVLDTPPLSAGADPALIAQAADTVLLVVDLGRTKRPDLRASIDTLSNVGVRPLGFVVNRPPRIGRVLPHAYTPVHRRYVKARRPGDEVPARFGPGLVEETARKRPPAVSSAGTTSGPPLPSPPGRTQPRK